MVVFLLYNRYGDIMEKIKIVYEDRDILVVNKPANLLTIATNKNENKTLYRMTREYIKKVNPKIKVFIVHRLDKDTSGLVVFAKSEKVKTILQNNWEQTVRKYYAVVTGKPEKHQVIKNYLKENKEYYVYVTDDKKTGKLAITEYDLIKKQGKYALLDILIKTGRKNQIRVHLNNLNLPIVGDHKYALDKTSRELLLHAYYLKFNHPITNKPMEFNIYPPKYFERYVKLDNNGK